MGEVKITGDHRPISQNLLTAGEKAADSLTAGMGSWTFIIFFLAFIALWVAANVYAWVNQWDPYPFILLNLALSCLAAIQAPIILMAQNRQTQKDRQHSTYDYAVNRKAEREIKEIKIQLSRIEENLKPKKKKKR
tara:strand:+ start:825 stop:1229 length:405 start_codon:yes stop_codon:yes gene_type:complete